MLYGFSGVILQGAIVTLELALSSVVLAVLIGLVGAGAKLSQNRVTGSASFEMGHSRLGGDASAECSGLVALF